MDHRAEAITSTKQNLKFDHSPTIIVVGAGLGGLAVSLGLAKQGYRVQLVERRSDWASQGSAFGVQPNGMKALKELCPAVEECLMQKGICDEKKNTRLYGWWMVRDAMLEQVLAYKGQITIHMGWNLRSFDDQSDPSIVQVIFRRYNCLDKNGEMKDERQEDDLVLEGSLLVAADGVDSTARKLLGLEAAKFSSTTFWRGALKEIPKGSVLEPLLDMGLTPLRNTNDPKLASFGRGSVIVNLINFHAEYPRKMTYTFNAQSNDIPAKSHPRSLLFQHFKDPEQQAILEEVFRLANNEDLHWPLTKRVIVLPENEDKRWGGCGRVALIGDAAHAMRPASGLGGSMAFEDAVILCRQLKRDKKSIDDLLKTRESTEAVIWSFEGARFDRVKRIWQDQWDLGEKIYSKSEKIEGWSPEFKDWVHAGV